MILHPDPVDLHWQDDGTLLVIVDGEPIDDLDEFLDAFDMEGAEYGPPADLVALIGADCECICHRGIMRTSSPNDCRCIDGKQTVTIETLRDSSCGGGVSHETVELVRVRGVPTALAPTDDGRYALTVEVHDD